jgi:hypothetical protein
MKSKKGLASFATRKRIELVFFPDELSSPTSCFDVSLWIRRHLAPLPPSSSLPSPHSLINLPCCFLKSSNGSRSLSYEAQARGHGHGRTSGEDVLVIEVEGSVLVSIAHVELADHRETSSCLSRTPRQQRHPSSSLLTPRPPYPDLSIRPSHHDAPSSRLERRCWRLLQPSTTRPTANHQHEPSSILSPLRPRSEPKWSSPSVGVQRHLPQFEADTRFRAHLLPPLSSSRRLSTFRPFSPMVKSG